MTVTSSCARAGSAAHAAAQHEPRVRAALTSSGES